MKRERSELQDPTEFTKGGREGRRVEKKANPDRGRQACLPCTGTRGDRGTVPQAEPLQLLPAGSDVVPRTKPRAFLRSLNFLVPPPPPQFTRSGPRRPEALSPGEVGGAAPASQDPRPLPAKPLRDDRTLPALGLSSHLCPAACSGGAGPRWRGASARSVW